MNFQIEVVLKTISYIFGVVTQIEKVLVRFENKNKQKKNNNILSLLD